MIVDRNGSEIPLGVECAWPMFLSIPPAPGTELPEIDGGIAEHRFAPLAWFAIPPSQGR